MYDIEGIVAARPGTHDFVVREATDGINAARISATIVTFRPDGGNPIVLGPHPAISRSAHEGEFCT